MIDLKTYVLENKKISSIDDYINESFRLGKNKVDTKDDFVDLDLPSKTLWCKYNVGATCKSNPKSWYGDYFMWGDIEPVTNKRCDWDNYKHCNGNYNKLTKYCPSNKINNWDVKGKPDNKLVLDLEDDIANDNMGGNCKMPTKGQLQELMNNTTNEWVKDYNDIQGLNGRLFKSKTNNNTLFIPAAGYYNSKNLYYAGSNVSIWSSTLHAKYPNDAYYLNSSTSVMYITDQYRCCGCPVRAVIN